MVVIADLVDPRQVFRTEGVQELLKEKELYGEVRGIVPHILELPAMDSREIAKATGHGRKMTVRDIPFAYHGTNAAASPFARRGPRQ